MAWEGRQVTGGTGRDVRGREGPEGAARDKTGQLRRPAAPLPAKQREDKQSCHVPLRTRIWEKRPNWSKKATDLDKRPNRSKRPDWSKRPNWSK